MFHFVTTANIDFLHQRGLAISDFFMAINFLSSAAVNLTGADIGSPQNKQFCSFNGFMVQTFVDQSTSLLLPHIAIYNIVRLLTYLGSRLLGAFYLCLHIYHAQRQDIGIAVVSKEPSRRLGCAMDSVSTMGNSGPRLGWIWRYRSL